MLRLDLKAIDSSSMPIMQDILIFLQFEGKHVYQTVRIPYGSTNDNYVPKTICSPLMLVQYSQKFQQLLAGIFEVSTIGISVFSYHQFYYALLLFNVHYESLHVYRWCSAFIFTYGIIYHTYIKIRTKSHLFCLPYYRLWWPSIIKKTEITENWTNAGR